MLSNPIRIDDADDPRIAGFVSIRERDLVGRDGLFVAEGKVVLNVLLSTDRFEPVSALILDNRLDGIRPTLAKASPAMPVYVASQSVLDRIAGFHLHRGVLALGRRCGTKPFRDLLSAMPRDALVLGLIGVANHDNVGSIFRNAAAFEADGILLDGSCCDPLYRKAIRVSVGAALQVPFARAATHTEIADALIEADFQCFALSPRGTVGIDELRPEGRVALLLGTEGEGLPSAIMERMTTVRIPMSTSFDSLNVAAASAIGMHRLWKGARLASACQLPSATL